MHLVLRFYRPKSAILNEITENTLFGITFFYGKKKKQELQFKQVENMIFQIVSKYLLF
jgi:hypothetical protein